MTLTTYWQWRPRPGTEAELVYLHLTAQMSRAGRAVDREACAQLAKVIQLEGHRSQEAVQLARALGLDPRYLPRRRSERCQLRV